MPHKDLEKKKAYHAEYYRKNMVKIKNRANDHYLENKDAFVQRAKDWAKNNRERYDRLERKSHLKRRYNLTIEEYDQLLEAQNYLCALCGEHLINGQTKRPDIDHDHATGKIRGILHRGCNTMLGHAKDDINILRKAILYLESQ